ncbi:MAG: hypothetical protein J5620_03590 [Alphaproteobacteria bacterium]|nr:hypothetical protein [Alphaproteobacteria bacterium]
MTNKIQDLINAKSRQEYATTAGRAMHTQMQHIFYTGHGWVGNANITKRISGISELMEYMGVLSRTEVPIAGTVNGKFISRRIDRLYVNNDTKKVVVLDYKTDADKNLFYKKYCEQLTEYYELLKQIYKGFNIECKILWLGDFTLENII